MSVICLENVVKQYGEVRALDGVNLTVERGEWLAIMGPSGSGKTTLLNLLGCLDVPTSGNVIIDGRKVAGLDTDGLTALRRETIGSIFQQFHLVPYLSALENVMLAQYFHSMADAAEAARALEAVGMGERLHHKPSQLSGGEQQRVCIARALVNYPAILLADEPTGNLDRANEEVVLELIRGFHQRGQTVILVTHNPEIARCADRMSVMSYGKLRACADASPAGPAATGDECAPRP
ncbi:MAG: ABC transporter ATP-binding protein [Candidatus Schekmanbacteria bacterium]|nr:ABC transporter ATP-binding protein [Candidatus Schekmanbacteria bacterium]